MAMAENTRTGRRKIVLAMDVHDPRIHEGALRYTSACPSPLDMTQTDTMPWQRSYVDTRSCAIILARLKLHIRPLRRNLSRLHRPLVVLCSDAPDGACPRVLEGDYAAGKLAAEYYLQRHFRRFAVACQGLDAGYAERIRGFEETLASHGYPVRRAIYSQYLDDSARSEPELGWGAYLMDQLNHEERPLAVFVLDDLVGASALRHCREAGIRVPEEVAVLAAGNDHLHCDYSDPPLSSIDMNRERLGWEAARLLHTLMEGRGRPATPIVVPPLGVVERRSTEILSAEDPRAMRALRHLMDHLREPLTTAALARTVGLSAAHLNRIFVECFGRTVKKELIRLRMQRVRELLATTDARGKEIAERTGFQTAAHLSRVFRQEHEMTMQTFRERIQVPEVRPWHVNPTAPVYWVPQHAQPGPAYR